MQKAPLVSTLMYHIYNRGVSRQKIFLHEQDYRFCQYKISILKRKYEINMITYCLMPTHYHMFLYTHAEAKNISKFIGNVQWIYAKYFNRRYKHYGHVFESRYNNRQVDPPNMKTMINYIHQNPVKEKLVRRIEDWPYKG